MKDDFSKFSIQNVGSNLYGKKEKRASTEIEFIQKLRGNLPIDDRRSKDESPIFPTSIIMFQKVQEVLRFFFSKRSKLCFPSHSQAIFSKLKIQSAQFFN
jgi:catabolite regulation protein CreA